MGAHNPNQRSGSIRALIGAITGRRAAGADLGAMPTVRNGELALSDSAWDAELPWDLWLQNLPPVDGWTPTATWMAQHGLGGGE